MVVAVISDTLESCLDAMCGNDCDFRNGLYSLDVTNIVERVEYLEEWQACAYFVTVHKCVCMCTQNCKCQSLYIDRYVHMCIWTHMYMSDPASLFISIYYYLFLFLLQNIHSFNSLQFYTRKGKEEQKQSKF